MLTVIHSPPVSSGHINSLRSASHREDQSLDGGGGGRAGGGVVMCFHRGVLSLGKCNRLEYQWDVPESVTAHLLSDCSFGSVSLWSGGPLSSVCFPQTFWHWLNHDNTTVQWVEHGVWEKSIHSTGRKVSLCHLSHCKKKSFFVLFWAKMFCFLE